MDRQIVHHDNLAALEGRNKRLFHIGKKQGSIHATLKDERGGHPAQTQGADKGDDFPMPVRRVIDQPLTGRVAAAKPDLLAHPASVRADHIGAPLLGGIQRFF
jgi:hypothetical protein